MRFTVQTKRKRKEGYNIIVVMLRVICVLIVGFVCFMHVHWNANSNAGVLLKETFMSKILIRRNGEGWKVNPGSKSEVATLQGYECKWVDFESTTGKTAKFCGYPFNDAVTWNIENKKRFHHCNALPQMWQNAGPKQENSVYLEIGANVGSCVMEMLLSTDANIIAFEPHPRNQFAMQKSVEALPQAYQDRFVLVPVALGAEHGNNTIFAAKGNFGNSVVGKIIKDNKRQQFEEKEQHQIVVERLSSIISMNADVPFVKLDAQGFECNILEGMGQDLAKKIRKIKFEVSQTHLRGQGCMDLLARFRNLGYDIFSEDEKTKIEEGDVNQFNRMVELMAVRKN